LITTPNGSYFRNKLPTYSAIKDFDALERQQFKPDADGHLFLITPGEMADLAGKAGLSVERMVVWGTPAVTGHIRLSMFASSALCWTCYHLERFSQELPATFKEKACFNLAAVLSCA
jgi:2-polyprenyl-6-hydroxyphenyl methylase/3-demethylubiquinone-9 3-methyltransferase